MSNLQRILIATAFIAQGRNMLESIADDNPAGDFQDLRDAASDLGAILYILESYEGIEL